MKKFIGGNWKMNLLESQAGEFAKALDKAYEDGVEVVLFPPGLMLKTVKDSVNRLGVGAQNLYFEEKGAYTGEISIGMLEDMGISHSLIGHSERRTVFLEDDVLINSKLKAVMKSRVTPVLCLGEHLGQRKDGLAEATVKGQLVTALDGVESIEGLIIAYEPVWAIGTGMSATPEDAESMAKFIRGEVERLYPGFGKKTRIIYGGSVNGKNIGDISKLENVDGVLVGGASLKLDEFTEIMRYGRD
ncbi:MAG: triose-phosphate isomerase [Tissierellia bacterium]|nr:triose-phosphate isomerase [Tissierellia bacterium]